MSAHLESRLRDILRERREGASAVAGSVRPDPSPVEARARLDTVADTLDGDVLDSPSGPCVVIDRFYPADHWHGTVRIGDVGGLSLAKAPELSLVGGQPSDAPTPGPLLFVDLETTGLAGGAGTYAFLVGCAYFEPHGFRTRQYFLGAFQHERTLLGEVERLVRRSAGLVSYNGKSFDVPMLETRYQFNRLPPPFEGYAHVDMLHVARRFWRSAPPAPGSWPDTDSCRLSAIERVLFGVRRVGDVQGFEIPNRYFD
jgi:hypothetical protein